jgi:hypothetical protein
MSKENEERTSMKRATKNRALEVVGKSTDFRQALLEKLKFVFSVSH